MGYVEPFKLARRVVLTSFLLIMLIAVLAPSTSYAHNNAPPDPRIQPGAATIPYSLSQMNEDYSTIPAGSTTPTRSVLLTALSQRCGGYSTDNNSFVLEIELRPFYETFTGVATHSSAALWGPSNACSPAQFSPVLIAGLSRFQGYKWQVRERHNYRSYWGYCNQYGCYSGSNWYTTYSDWTSFNGGYTAFWIGNMQPVAVADSYTADSGVPMLVPTGNQSLLANDSDPDGDTFSVTYIDSVSAQGGTVVGSSYNNGSFTYTSPAGFSGVDTFTYRIRDSYGDFSPPATVTITVNPTLMVTNTNNNGPGSLRQAIADVQPGNLIRFAPDLSGTILLGSELVIDKNMRIDGPGSWQMTVSGNNAGRIFLINPGVTVSMDDLTIANGKLPAGNDGAAIYNHGGTINLTRMTIRDNGTEGSGTGGGAIYSHNSGVINITDSRLEFNTSGKGGAIYFTSGSSVTLTRSILENNSADYGGAVYAYHGTLTVNDGTFSDNTATGDGGAVNVQSGGHVTITNSRILDNHSLMTNGGGGAIYNLGNLTVSGSTFSGNTAPNVLVGGGASLLNGGGGTATVTNATFSGNSTIGAGGAALNFGTLTLTNVTIANNTAGNGALYRGDGSITLHNTLVADNTGGNCYGTITNAGNNLQYPGTSCGGTILTADPLLGPLADNGGAMQTHNLELMSPAIDAGGACGLTTDQRGEDRDPKCDIGAYEYQYPHTALNITVDSCDAAQLIRAIERANSNAAGDVIELNGTCAYTLTAINHTSDGPNGLPSIVPFTSGGTLTIYGHGAIIQRDNAAPNFRLFHAATDANLTLDNLSLLNGRQDNGGGIFSWGTVTLNNVDLSNNTAVGYGLGGAIHNEGTLSITGGEISQNRAHNGGGIVSRNTLNITNTTIAYNTASNNGGGILHSNGTLTITGSTITSNNAADGGGIAGSANASISSTTISDNSATQAAGGIVISGGTAALVNVNISGNSAPKAGGLDVRSLGIVTMAGGTIFNNHTTAGNGGGVYSNATLSIEDSDISANTVSNSGRGAGLYNVSPGTLTITGTRITGNSAPGGGDGGALWNESTATISNSTLSNNTATDAGGAIANFAVLDITDSTIANNTTTDAGGAIYNVTGGDLTIVSSTISGNRVTATTGSGGAIYNTAALELTGSTVSGNTAGNYGGGIHNVGTLSIQDSVVENNTAVMGGGISSQNNPLTIDNTSFIGNQAAHSGGGAYIQNSNATLTNCTFSGNTATTYAGGVGAVSNVLPRSTLTIMGCTFLGNSAGHAGGGVHLAAMTTTVTNTTITGNQSAHGGGLRSAGGTNTTITNSTISANGATVVGGNLIVGDDGIIHLRNTIVANSTAGENCYSTIVDGGKNLQYPGTTCSSSITVADPLLGPLADSGGATQTMMPQFDSPAIDAGNPANCPADDQRGAARPFDGDGDGATNCDIGAVERHLTLPTLSIIDASAQPEGDSGTSILEFTVVRMGPNDGTSTVQYATVGGTATVLDGDYIATSGTLTFASGVTTQTIQVMVNGDTLFEPDETFSVTLAGPAFATLENAIAFATITSDDLCTDPASINTASQLDLCIQWANATAGPQTLELGADIPLSVELPHITSEMTLNGNGHYVSGNNAVRVFYIEGSGNLSLNEIIVQDGYADYEAGGGVYNEGALSITDATFLNNSAYSYGGGIFNTGTTSISNTTFSTNSTIQDSGGSIANTGTLTLNDGQFSNNSARYFGGGIFNNGTASVVHTTFANNTAEYGGALDTGLLDTQTMVDSSVFVDNYAAYGGGAIHTSDNLSQILAVTYSTFSGNRSGTEGGGIRIFGGTVTIDHTTFSGNTADYDSGGAIYIREVSGAIVLTVSNSTFSRNSASSSGGGIFNDSGILKVTNTTFYSNSAPNGGNLYIASGTEVQLASTLMGSGGIGENCRNNGMLTDSGYNLSDDDSCGFSAPGSQNNVALNLGPLANNGGLTQTHMPLLGSPAIDSGSNTICAAAPVNNLDQRGEARPFDGDGDGIDTCDIGAVERRIAVPSLSINDVARAEGDSGTTTFTFTVTRSGATDGTSTMQYATADGTATVLDGDYATASGTLTFGDGVSEQSIGVTVNGDMKFELDETFTTVLSSPTYGIITTGEGLGTIQNDDALPTFSVSDITVTEGDTGTVNADIAVTLSAASWQVVTVQYATANGTAVAGDDYTATSGTLTFDPGGSLSQTISGSVLGDLLCEDDETFSVVLSSPSGAELDDVQGIATIADDDLCVSELRSPADGVLTSDNTPTLIWQEVAGADLYEIQLALDAGFDAPEQTALPVSPAYTTSLLQDNTVYYWRVRALNNLGETSDWSDVWSFTVDIARLRAPTLTLPKDRANTPDQTPTLSWSAVSGAKAYQVQWSSEPDLAGAHVAERTTLTYTLPEQPYGIYFWRVRARDAAERWSDWSLTRTLTVTFLSSPPNAKHLTDTTPTFTWKSVAGATNYRLKVYNDGALSHVVFEKDTTGLSVTPDASKALGEGQHWWRVRVDRASGSQWTPAWTFTVTPPIPVAPRLVGPANYARLDTNPPAFEWQSVTGEATYQLQIDNNDTFASPALDAEVPAGTALPYTPTGSLPDGGRYFWRVRAINSVGVAGAWSARREFTLTQIAAPVLLSPPNPTAAQTLPAFTWNGVPNAVMYQFQMSTTLNFARLVHQAIDLDTTGYIVTAPVPDGKYFWRVRGVTAAGVAGRWSAAWVITLDTTGPAMPVLLTLADKAGTTDTTPTFTWGAPAGAKGYQLQLATNPDFTGSVRLVPVNGLTYTVPDTGALSYGVYYWRVQARDALNNWGAWSPARSFAVTILKTPKDGQTTTDTTPTFTWAAVAGATFLLEVNASPDFTSDPLPFTYTGTALAATPSTTKALAPATYYWRVQVQPAGLWMPTRTLVISPTKPAQVVLLAPAGGTLTNDNTPTLSWKPVLNATTYQVQIDNNGTFTSPEQDVTVGGSLQAYIASDLPDGLYSWRVRAVNSAGAPGAWSYKRTFTVDTTPLPAPLLVAPLDGASSTNTKLALSWGAVAGVFRYQIQLDPVSDFPRLVVDAGTLLTYKSPTPLSRGVYAWRVRTVDKAGNVSAWSETRSFTILAGVTAPLLPTQTPVPTDLPIEPAVEATAEPPLEATFEPATAPTNEPSAEPTSLPTVEPTVEPATPTPDPALLVVESDDAQVQVSGQWTTHDTALASGGRYRSSSGSADDTLSLSFTGSRVDVVFVQHPALGSFALLVDETLVQTVDSTAPDTVFGARLSLSLGAGPHTLRIVPVSGVIAIDAFAVEALAEPPAPPTPEPTVAPPAATPAPTDTAQPTVQPPEATPTSTAFPLLTPEPPAGPTLDSSEGFGSASE